MLHTYVTLAFDGWTNCTGTKITNVMAISKGVAYFIKSIPNATERNTAIWRDQHIRPIVDDMIANGIKINAFVTDNGATETCVRNKLATAYNIVWINCAAHKIDCTLQSCASHR